MTESAADDSSRPAASRGDHQLAEPSWPRPLRVRGRGEGERAAVQGRTIRSHHREARSRPCSAAGAASSTAPPGLARRRRSRLELLEREPHSSRPRRIEPPHRRLRVGPATALCRSRCHRSRRRATAARLSATTGRRSTEMEAAPRLAAHRHPQRQQGPRGGDCEIPLSSSPARSRAIAARVGDGGAGMEMGIASGGWVLLLETWRICIPSISLCVTQTQEWVSRLPTRCWRQPYIAMKCSR
jgi:hypothetical protein